MKPTILGEAGMQQQSRARVTRAQRAMLASHAVTPLSRKSNCASVGLVSCKPMGEGTLSRRATCFATGGPDSYKKTERRMDHAQTYDGKQNLCLKGEGEGGMWILNPIWCGGPILELLLITVFRREQNQEGIPQHLKARDKLPQMPPDLKTPLYLTPKQQPC